MSDQAMNPLLAVGSVLSSAVALWLVGACLLGSEILSLIGHLPFPRSTSSTTVSEELLFVGAPFMLLIFPGLWAAFFGILGKPRSWWTLTRVSLETLFARYDFWTGLGLLLGTICQLVMFRLWDCPDQCHHWPRWIRLILFREPVRILQPQQDNNNKVQDEYWIFVNGICTTSDIARTNQKMLSDLFSRPIYVCHNPTDGVAVDLLECIIGKLGYLVALDHFWMTKPKKLLHTELDRALKCCGRSNRYKRVVLIAHSQGTIIASQALRGLDPILTAQYLEVYAFANCAHQMSSDLLHLENLSNRSDTVAWLGALFPFPKLWRDIRGKAIDIGGNHITEPTLWGHLLNVHYLTPFRNDNAFATSRLHTLSSPYQTNHRPGVLVGAMP
jgi:hypothetical protein